MQAAWVDESPTCKLFAIKLPKKSIIDCQESINYVFLSMPKA